MDFDEIGARLSNLTMYDVKQLYTTAKNYALNISEIEAKVREATNDDPWGASSSNMQEIAAATHNFQDFNEIMPTIYSRFMEKEAREWRQIYKALQLLEYIVKHGSERVVDDARSHVSTIKILRNFHYIDEQGKDQGINVRNRAKELSELLSDVDRIRLERRKARSNKNKYQGGGNGDFVPGSGGGRYGGFGSDSAFAQGIGSSGSGRGGDYGGDGSHRRDASFDQYDAGEYEEASHSGGGRGGSSAPAPAPAPKKEAKVVDLFSFDDDEPAASVTAPAAAPHSKPAASVDAFGDDFDDFQAAPTPATAPAPSRSSSTAAAPLSKVNASANVFDFLDSAPAASPPAAQPLAPSRTISTTSSQPLSPVARTSSGAVASPSATSTVSKGLSGFDDLWSTSATAVGAQPKTGSGANGKGKMTMAEMAKNQSSNAMWNNGSSAVQAQQKKDIFDFL